MEVSVGLVVRDGAGTGLCARATPVVEMGVAAMCCREDLREKGERGLDAKEPDRLECEVGDAIVTVSR